MGNETEIIIKASADHLARKGAETFSLTARKSIGQSGSFTVAISGGSTPRAMHRLLAQEPYVSDIPWQKTHLFWVDERCVPSSHPASNFGIAMMDFLDHVPIPAVQIHHMPAERPPEEGASVYERELREFFQGHEGDFPIFDLIYLGIGTDGHTASLFPGQRALEERQKWVVAVKGGQPDVSRLTLTYPVLNHSRQIIFMVSGKEKAAVIKAIFEDKAAGFPAQKIHPLNGELRWLLDQDAASLTCFDYKK